MKVEKLSKGNKKKIIMLITIIVLAIGIIYITNSRAKYQITKSVQIVNGIVNYSLYDFQILSMYKVEDGQETPIDTMPSAEKYAIDSERSSCKNNNGKNNQAILKTINGNHTIANLNKLDKCTLYFNRTITVTELIASKTTQEGQKEFTDIETADNTGKLYSDTDDLGTTYYFRGKVKDNWVKFGEENGEPIWWRIIRINGNNSIRIIYTGTGETAPTSDGYLNNNTTGSQLQTKAYNAYYNDNKYVGYMYGTERKGSAGKETTPTTRYEDAHANNYDSDIKQVLDTWYKTNLKTSYEQYIDPNAGFCNDRKINTQANVWWSSDTAMGYGKNATAYAPWSRLLDSSGRANSKHTPTFKCSQTEDTFTLPGAKTPSNEDYGNHKLLTNNGTGDNSPIGLITIDEAVHAGGYYNRDNNQSDNKQFYLYTCSAYWTMSPHYFSTNGYAHVFYVDSSGGLNNYLPVSNANVGVRPVINIKANTKFTGSGTASNPFVVQ